MKFIQIFKLILILLALFSTTSCEHKGKKLQINKKSAIIVYETSINQEQSPIKKQKTKAASDMHNDNSRRTEEENTAEKAETNNKGNNAAQIIHGKVVNVAVLLPLSGRYQAWGQQIKDSLTLAQADAEALNSSGYEQEGQDANGDSFQPTHIPNFNLHFIDSGSEADSVDPQALNKIETEEYNAIIGPVFLGQTKFMLKNHAFSENIPIFTFSSNNLLTKIPEAQMQGASSVYGIGVDFLDKLQVSCDYWYLEHKQCHKFVYYLPNSMDNSGDAEIETMFEGWIADKEKLIYRNVALEIGETKAENKQKNSQLARYLDFIIGEQKKYDTALSRKGLHHKTCRAIAIVLPNAAHQLSSLNKLLKNSQYTLNILRNNQLIVISAKSCPQNHSGTELDNKLLFSDLDNQENRSEFRAHFIQRYSYSPELLAYLAYDSFSLLRNAFYYENNEDNAQELTTISSDWEKNRLIQSDRDVKLEGYEDIIKHKPTNSRIIFDKRRLEGKFKGLSGSFRIEKNNVIRIFQPSRMKK